MPISFIGLGLFDEKDITLKGLERARNSEEIFIERYTSRLIGTNLKKIEELVENDIKELSRKDVEEKNTLLDNATKKDVSFMVPGDPMISTTHSYLRLKALKKGIDVNLVHAPSIFTAAAGLSGLQNYKFSKSATIQFPRKGKISQTPYEVLKENLNRGLHTLLFLDLNIDNSNCDLENGNEKEFMTAKEALRYLLDLERTIQEGVINDETIAVVIGRAGSEDPLIEAGKISDLINRELGDPLHVLIIPGDLHFLEEEHLKFFGLKNG